MANFNNRKMSINFSNNCWHDPAIVNKKNYPYTF